MKRWTLLIPMLCFAIFLSACSKDLNYNKQVERVPKEALELSGKEYTAIGESENMLLFINPSTGSIRWQNKNTGKYLETKIFDSEQSDVSLKSDVVAYYFSGQRANVYGSYSNMDTYTYSVETETMNFEQMDNGVRICYSLGSNKVTYKDFPAYISEERLNELVLQYLDEKQKSTVIKQFKKTKSGIYARITNKDNPLAGLAAKQLYSLFYEVGHYTYDELEKDNREHEKLDEMPSRQKIDLTMEYSLDGDDLVVRIPTAEMSWNEEYPLKSLDVLPYFLSTKEKENGYLFIPDGSGALINLDNTKLKEFQFSSRYYGGDVLVNAEGYSTTDAYMTLPVYGIKTPDYAVLGIIEKGAEVATLSAYVNGAYNNIPYSRVSLNFVINEDQTLATYNGATTNYTLKRVSTDYYSEDIQIRYCFLTGEDADYCGMALAYRDYLTNTGVLKSKEEEENAPFFVELLGAINKQAYFLGIPYEGIQTLTTFKQAETMLMEMKDQKINNIKVQYTGMVNEGINQRAVEKVQVLNQLGGKKGLKKLLKTADNIGAEIYPNILLQTAYTSKDLSKKERAFFISGQVAQIYDFDMIQFNPIKSSDYPRYIISPFYLEDYVEKFLKSYDKLKVGRLASDDLLTFISGDYRKGNNRSITNSIKTYLEALDTIASEHTLMLSNPISLAYEKCDYITDLSVDSSNLKVYDREIPFTQLVLNGSIPYSTECINDYSKDMDEYFLKALETKSGLKFRFMAADTSVLENTRANDVFSADYKLWKDRIGDYYQIYNEFYQKVKNAKITKHEIMPENKEHIVVTYSNGVKVYLNYSDEDTTIQGVLVAAKDFVIQE